MAAKRKLRVNENGVAMLSLKIPIKPSAPTQHLDNCHLRLIQNEERVGISALHAGLKELEPSPERREYAQTDALRWVLREIAKHVEN